ncbi:MAG: hypothetical protein AAF824_15270 [Bacteroidota bacterium]
MHILLKFILVASLLYTILFSPAKSQNILFIPFGQDLEEVRGFVDENTILSELTVHEKEKQILITDSLRSMNYEFHEKGLYRITDTRVYEDREQAKLVVKACLDYMKLFNRDIARPKKGEKIDHYIVIGDNKIVEVSITGYTQTNKSTEAITIQLTSTGLDYAPKEEINYLTGLFNY